ncbi:Nuclear import receptor [Entophlyctis sp. JEL0112]|nr:Nuclear import receptor [Entophlyctis sp. JEL0112]
MGKAEGNNELWHGHVTALTVAPEYRRMNLAKKLMGVLETVSEKIYNTYFVDLFVRKSNSVAIGMYKGFGYSVYRTVLGYYHGAGGEGEEDAYGNLTESSLMEANSLTDAVLAAVARLYAAPSSLPSSAAADAAAADLWLRDFQKSPDAWKVAECLLRSDAVAFEPLLFAAQTLRQKTRYDMAQIETSAQRILLRDTLIALLIHHRSNSRAIVRQLSLALASLSTHLKHQEWPDPIQTVVEIFRAEQDWPILIQILSALPYEYESPPTESSLFLDREDASARRQTVIFANSSNVLHSVLMILQKCGKTNPDLEKQSLDCIRAWLEAGDVALDKVSATPLIPVTFSYLLEADQDEGVYDAAVDILCEIIRRAGSRISGNRESPSTFPLVEQLFAGFSSLGPQLSNAIAQTDEEKIRALCTLFVYAGESFMNLILTNWDSWQIIVAAILACTSIRELEIVAITFQFWMIFADEVESQIKNPSNPRLQSSPHQPDNASLLEIFRRLNDVMIGHLHYPANVEQWVAKERDEFRDFRHNMGDVLKACVLVLGEKEALARPYAILKSFVTDPNLGGSGGALDPSVPWQSIEAPLFALRTIGRNISDSESTVLPAIMSMLPQLPSHPKVRYAAILVIGRYAGWTRLHPEYIPYQMTFISKGFEDAESVSAAAQSLKYLCDECGDVSPSQKICLRKFYIKHQQLVGYLSQLHPFYMSAVKQMGREDRRDVVAALAHVIKHVPAAPSSDPNAPDLLKVLQMFCSPIAQRLNEIDVSGSAQNVSELRKDLQAEVCDLIDQFTIFMSNAMPVDPNFSGRHPYSALFEDMWPLLRFLLFSRDAKVITAISKLIVKCVNSLKEHFRESVFVILPQLAATFQLTECSAVIWAASNALPLFSGANGQIVSELHSFVQNISHKAFECILDANGKIENISPVIEDFFLLLGSFTKTFPQVVLESPLLPSFLGCAIACMHIQQFDTWLALYSNFLATLLALASPISSARERPPIPAHLLAPLNEAVRTNSAPFTSALMTGLVNTFPHREDISGEGGRDLYVVGAIVVGFCDALAGAEGVQTILRACESVGDAELAREVAVKLIG